jgi:hypothetical protein
MLRVQAKESGASGQVRELTEAVTEALWHLLTLRAGLIEKIAFC